MDSISSSKFDLENDSIILEIFDDLNGETHDYQFNLKLNTNYTSTNFTVSLPEEFSVDFADEMITSLKKAKLKMLKNGR